MKKTLQERLKTIEAVRRAERTALRVVVVGIGADVAHTPLDNLSWRDAQLACGDFSGR
ncbi:hypothetical protein ACE10Z_32525 [Bradyrhizobium sp. Pha-3]|uniref:hypothetical protein n=1 Tax=Bradyrhizobium sp. Pha-3 TaxID=208375 RepID=UPI0035D50750